LALALALTPLALALALALEFVALTPSMYVLQDHYDDERNKTIFHNTTRDPARPRLNTRLQRARPRPIFWS